MPLHKKFYSDTNLSLTTPFDYTSKLTKSESILRNIEDDINQSIWKPSLLPSTSQRDPDMLFPHRQRDAFFTKSSYAITLKFDDSEDSFFSTIEVKRDASVLTDNSQVTDGVNTARTGATAQITPPPPYYDERDSYILRDGRYIRAPTPPPTTYEPRTNPNTHTTSQRRPPPYSNFDPFFRSLFDDKKIRTNFVCKVFTLVAIQLLFTFGSVAVSIFVPSVKQFMIKKSLVLLITGSVSYMVLVLVVSCFTTPRRSFPCNFLLLMFITIALTMVTCVLSCYYHTFIVLVSFGTTALILIFVTVLAFTPCIDITGKGIYLVVLSVILFIYGIIAGVLLWFGYVIFWIIFAALVTILFSFYLLFDIQLIIGGRRMELSPEEYILGALTVYVDVVMIFWYAMTLIGYCSR